MDILAGILELIGIWKVGDKKKIAFVFYTLANVIWIYVAFHSHVYGLLLVVVPAIFMNVINWTKWSRDEILDKC